MTAPPWRTTREGVAIAIRLTPRSSRDAVDGVKADSAGARHIAARVRAVPDKGAANAALERLVAQWLGWPAGTVAVSAGHTARLKTVTVKGDAEELSRRLHALVGRDLAKPEINT